MAPIRERYCVIVPALYALEDRRSAGAHISTALKAKGVPRKFFEELFLHLSLLLGFPALLEGLEQLKRISPSRSPLRPASGPRQHNGRKVLTTVYGSQTSKLLRNLSALHPELPDIIVYDVYGRIFTRPGLTLGEREIINVTVLAIQGLERQLFSHVRGAAKAGVTADGLRRIGKLLRGLGSKRSHRAAEFVDAVVSQRKKW